MATFKGKIRPVLLKDFAKQIVISSDEAILKITAAGWSVRVVDPAHVMFTEINLSKGDFEEYRAMEEFTVAVDLTKFVDFLSKVTGDMADVKITTEAATLPSLSYRDREYPAGHIEIQIGLILRTMPLSKLEGMTEPKIPTEKEMPTEEITTTTKNFADKIKAAFKTNPEHIGIYTHDRRWGIMGYDAPGENRKENKSSDWNEPYPAFKSTALSLFPPDYINSIASAIVSRESDRPLKLKIGGSMPVIIEYNYNHGSLVRYVLAQRDDSENRGHWAAAIALPVGGAMEPGEVITWSGTFKADELRHVIGSTYAVMTIGSRRGQGFDAALKADSEGIFLKSVSPDFTILIEATIPPVTAKGNATIAIDLVNLLPLLAKIPDDTDVLLEMGNSLYVTIREMRVRIEGKDPAGLPEPKMPKLNPNVSIYPIMPDPLQRWLKEAAGKLSDRMTFYAVNEQPKYFGAIAEDAKDYVHYRIELDMPADLKFSPSIVSQASFYTVDRVYAFLHAVKDFGPVTLEFSTDYPLRIRSGNVTFLVAPMIEGEREGPPGVPRFEGEPFSQRMQLEEWTRKAKRRPLLHGLPVGQVRPGQRAVANVREPVRPAPEPIAAAPLKKAGWEMSWAEFHAAHPSTPQASWASGILNHIRAVVRDKLDPTYRPVPDNVKREWEEYTKATSAPSPPVPAAEPESTSVSLWSKFGNQPDVMDSWTIERSGTPRYVEGLRDSLAAQNPTRDYRIVPRFQPPVEPQEPEPSEEAIYRAEIPMREPVRPVERPVKAAETPRREKIAPKAPEPRKERETPEIEDLRLESEYEMRNGVPVIRFAEQPEEAPPFTISGKAKPKKQPAQPREPAEEEAAGPEEFNPEKGFYQRLWGAENEQTFQEALKLQAEYRKLRETYPDAVRDALAQGMTTEQIINHVKRYHGT